MPCRICGSEETIHAHLVPRSFALEVTLLEGDKHALVQPGKPGLKTSNTGQYDPAILCGPCDNRLGRHENDVFKLLKSIRAMLAPPGTTVEAEFEGDTLVRFAAGICWKFSVTSWEEGHLDVGPYQPVLAQAAFEADAIPASIDLAAVQLQIGDAKAYFYRTPRQDRQLGVNFLRFSMGGFVFFLKMDRRPTPPLFDPPCWLKGQDRCRFPVMSPGEFEEWRVHFNIATRPDVRSYFDKVRTGVERKRANR